MVTNFLLYITKDSAGNEQLFLNCNNVLRHKKATNPFSFLSFPVRKFPINTYMVQKEIIHEIVYHCV